jgi:streptogramin lyase
LLIPIDPRYDTTGHAVRLAPPAEAGTEFGRIAVSGNSLWITVPETTLLRVDPANPDHRDTITPQWGTAGPVVDLHGGLWVAGSGNAADVFPVAGRTPEVGTGIPVGGPIHGLAVLGDTVWVLSGGAAFDRPRPALRAVDLRDQLPGTLVGVGQDPVAVAAAAGSLWVADRSGKTIWRVDPSRGRVVERIELGAQPEALAGDRNGIWVAVG